MRIVDAARIMAVLMGVLLATSPALAQTGIVRTPEGELVPIEHSGNDIVGSWNTTHTEDLWERRSGLEVGDFTGVPLNEAGKLNSATWDPGWFSIPEEQCRPHTGIYGPRGPWDVTIEAEYSPDTQGLMAYHFYAGLNSRTVWMDARPHPPEYARHTFAGFSTGRWEGDTLVVKTTHTKAGYLQRNGIPHSDQMEGLEYWTRQGDTLLVTSFIHDPIYLSEPRVKTTSFLFERNPANGRRRMPNCTPFEVIIESPDRPPHWVPHFLPGNYEQAREFQEKRKVPPEAAFGGAETLYPEYIPKLKEYRDRFVKSFTVTRPPLVPGRGQPAMIGYWTLNRGQSKYNVSWNRVDLDDRDGSAPEKRTITIEPTPDGGLKHTIDTQIVANDTGVHRQTYTMKLDGKDYPTAGGAIETFAYRRVDANRFERVGKLKGETVETATITVSADGKTMTIANKGSIQGQTYDNVQVFTRDPQ